MIGDPIGLIENNIDNIYDSIRSIFCDFQYYGYNSLEGAYNHLLSIIPLYFNQTVDLGVINNLLKTTELSCNRQNDESFKNQVKKKYDKCIVSGNPVIECDVAHIVPLNQNYNFDPDNGLLISTNLHRLFDLYYWTINPDTLEIVVSPNAVKEQTSIVKYVGNSVNQNLINNHTRSYLSQHFQTFEKINKCKIC